MQIRHLIFTLLTFMISHSAIAQTSSMALKACGKGERLTGCQGNLYRCAHIPKSSPAGTCTYTANYNLCGDRGFSWESCCQTVCAARNQGKEAATVACAERCSNAQAGQGRFNIDPKGKSR
jgi:hypothetical protein